MIKDGVHYITCDRVGCNKTIGAQRYEDGKVVEEEWVPDAVITEEGKTFCNKECQEHEQDFLTIEKCEDVSCD